MDDLNTALTKLIMRYGRANVELGLAEVTGEIKARNERPLPSGFRRFTDNDWEVYAGAECFADASSPIITDFKVLVDVPDFTSISLEFGAVEETDIVISQGEGSNIRMSFALSTGYSLSTEVDTVEHAISLAVLLHQSKVPTSLALLQSLGYAAA